MERRCLSSLGRWPERVPNGPGAPTEPFGGNTLASARRLGGSLALPVSDSKRTSKLNLDIPLNNHKTSCP